MQEAHIQIGLFLPTKGGSRDIISAKIPKSHPHLASRRSHTHTPIAKSQSRSIYYPPPSLPIPPPYSNVFLVLALSGKPDSSVKIACLARLPLLYLSSTWPGPASAGLLGKIPG